MGNAAGKTATNIPDVSPRPPSSGQMTFMTAEEGGKVLGCILLFGNCFSQNGFYFEKFGCLQGQVSTTWEISADGFLGPERHERLCMPAQHPADLARPLLRHQRRVWGSLWSSAPRGTESGCSRWRVPCTTPRASAGAPGTRVSDLCQQGLPLKILFPASWLHIFC